MIKLFIIVALAKSPITGKPIVWTSPEVTTNQERCERMTAFMRKQLNNPTLECKEVKLEIPAKGI